MTISGYFPFDQIGRVAVEHERMSRHAAPRGNIFRSAGIGCKKLENPARFQALHTDAEFQYQIPTANAACIPLLVVIRFEIRNLIFNRRRIR
jgi:hypothetical protein